MEMSVFLRKQIYGEDSKEVVKACQVFTTSCNTLAMNCLQKDDYMKAYELLKKAELLTEPRGYLHDDKVRLKLRAVTFNNLGCFYKRRGKLHAALQYLDKALKIELASEEVDNPAGTHLNLCATLSQLGRHQPALEHAQCALELLKQSIARKAQQRGGGGKGAAEDASILAIAYHNLAVEQEHLGLWDGAIESYSQSVKMAEAQWGPEHAKTTAIRHSFLQAQKKREGKRAALPSIRKQQRESDRLAAQHAGSSKIAATHARSGAARALRAPRGSDRGGARSVPPGMMGGKGGMSASAPATPPRLDAPALGAGARGGALRLPALRGAHTLGAGGGGGGMSAPVSSRRWGGSALPSRAGSAARARSGAATPDAWHLSGGGDPRQRLGPRTPGAPLGLGEERAGPLTPGGALVVRRRPAGASSAPLEREGDFDDMSAPPSPRADAPAPAPAARRGASPAPAPELADAPFAGSAAAEGHSLGRERSPPGALEFREHAPALRAVHLPGRGMERAAPPRRAAGDREALAARVAQLEESLNALSPNKSLGGGAWGAGEPADEIRAKCRLDDDTRALLLPRRALGYAQLRAAVEEEFALPGARIKYRDADGDLVPPRPAPARPSAPRPP
jgi:hypothetical protein